jgi:hypothetical protein
MVRKVSSNLIANQNLHSALVVRQLSQTATRLRYFLCQKAVHFAKVFPVLIGA